MHSFADTLALCGERSGTKMPLKAPSKCRRLPTVRKGMYIQSLPRDEDGDFLDEVLHWFVVKDIGIGI